MENDVQFERVVATVSMMPVLTKIAKILGPKGLMPSVKAGTLNNDIMAALSTISNAATYVFDKDSLTISAPIALVFRTFKMRVSSVLHLPFVLFL